MREGGRFNVTTEKTLDLDLGVGILPKPLQQPRPEIVGTVVAPFSKGVIAMGTRNFHPLSANFLLPQWVATHWPNYVQGKESVGRNGEHRRLAGGPHGVRRRRWGGGRGLRPHRREQPVPVLLREDADQDGKIGRLELFKSHRDQPDEEVTLDSVVDQLVITGTPDSVADQLLAFREQTGEFGELVYAGLDWVDPDLAKRSMELMAEEVMPRINAV